MTQEQEALTYDAASISVLEGLKNCEEGLVRLTFNERSSPGKFTLAENYVYIVMPITIEG